MTNTLIEVQQGQLEGITRKSILTEKEYFCYLGIPYAKPPVGDLRFQVSIYSKQFDT